MPPPVSVEAAFLALAARCQPAVEMAGDSHRLAHASSGELELAIGFVSEAVAPYVIDSDSRTFVARHSAEAVPPRTIVTLKQLYDVRQRRQDELLRRSTPYGAA